MLDTFKQLTFNQFEAAICTLNACIDACSDDAWDAPVGNHTFCQVVFHTLFFADVYLGTSENDFQKQPFHRENTDFFRDYEEMEQRKPTHFYEKETIRAYVDHCRRKASEVIAAETQKTLRAPAGFSWLDFTRAEVYVYNIRHIQHHAAQMSLRLRIDADQDIPWVGTGWKEISP